MMKKFSLIGGIILSNILYAGGDIAPIEDPIAVEAPQTVVESSFYLGIGVSPLKLHNDLTDEEFSTTALTLQAGYQYDSFIALEARDTQAHSPK